MTTHDRPLYFDHNATTPVLPEVLDAMLPYLREHFGNPSSQHAYGRASRDAIAKARVQVASLLSCESSEIVWTSGGTEASNLALVGTCSQHSTPGRVVITRIEHPATSRVCAELARRGWDVVSLPVTREGVVDLTLAHELIGPGTTLVSAMHSNNETGALQPIEALGLRAREVGATMHTDAAQSVGRVPLDMRTLPVDLLSIAGHKVYAPKGIGALYLRHGTRVEPVLRGAGHEGGVRPGTENVASIVGLGMACEVAQRDMAHESKRQRELVEHLSARVLSACPDASRTCAGVASLPNTLHLCFDRVLGDALLAALPGLAASTGSACHEGHHEPSSVLTAMGLPRGLALGAVRLTLGRSTTRAEVEQAAAMLVAAYKRLATMETAP
ncbi:MAG: cysteine desulfurase family protein [Deltaproteobacteria bacterium]|nr:cysteine desulfurase family protein [Deltaproteobacteria bacterium]